MEYIFNSFPSIFIFQFVGACVIDEEEEERRIEIGDRKKEDGLSDYIINIILDIFLYEEMHVYFEYSCVFIEETHDHNQ